MRVVGDGEVVGVDRIHRRLTRTRAHCARRGARQDREFHAGTDGALRAARLHHNGRDLARKVLQKLRAKPPGGGGGNGGPEGPCSLMKSGGGGGSRTRVREYAVAGIYMRSRP